MQPPQTGDRQSGACFAFPARPLSCCCCNYHTRVLGPTAAQLSGADSTRAAAGDKAARPETGGACASNAETSPTMKLVCTYSPAQPAWGNLSFLTKKGRGGLERGEAFPHPWQPRAEQVLLLGTFSHVSILCRGLSFAAALGDGSSTRSKETPKASRHPTQLKFKYLKAGRSLNEASVCQQAGRLDLLLSLLQHIQRQIITKVET